MIINLPDENDSTVLDKYWQKTVSRNVIYDTSLQIRINVILLHVLWFQYMLMFETINLCGHCLTIHTFSSKIINWVCIYNNQNLVTLQEETSSPIPTHAPCHSSLWNHWTGGQVFRSGVSCPVWLQRHPADLVGLHKDDGSQGSETRLWGGYSQC